jgi:hypothetical protein
MSSQLVIDHSKTDVPPSVALDELVRKIDAGLQSRTRVAAMTGQAGNLQAFREEVARDRAEIEGLRVSLGVLIAERISPRWVAYATVQAAAVEVRRAETRVEQLSARFVAALAEDDVQRQRRYEEVIAHVNRTREA